MSFRQCLDGTIASREEGIPYACLGLIDIVSFIRRHIHEQSWMLSAVTDR